MQLVIGTEVDRYVVEGLIGRGGMASVYQVRHTQLGTVHALKILEVSSQLLRERLLREGRVQATLDHPNVVAVTDVISAGGVTGLLMQYVHGPTLDTLLQHGRLPLQLVDALVPGILAGVAAAHAANVVHRDLKPANILLQSRRGTVIPKVADFGLVKLIGDDDVRRTRSGAMMGTPQYMSPEQIRATKDVDARTDLFALGAILYELATGVRAYPGDAPFEIFERITRGDHRPTTEIAPDLPDRIHQAIEAALRLDPDARVATCAALWSLWAGADVVDLGVAADRTVQWPKEPLDLLAALSPSSLALDPTPAATVSLGSSQVSPPGAAREPPLAPPPAEVTGRGSWRAPAAGAATVLMLAALLLTWNAWTGTTALDPAVAPVARPELPPEPIPSAPVDAVPPPVPTVVPAEPPTHPVPAPPPVRPAPTQPPVPVQAQTGSVRSEGTADAVWLVSAAGGVRVELGTVPVGTYRVNASFGDRSVTDQAFTVAAGESWVVQCKAEFARCNPIRR